MRFMQDLALQMEWLMLAESSAMGRAQARRSIQVVGDPLWTRRYKDHGYVLKRERWQLPGCEGKKSDECEPTEITAAYNEAGDYIGDSKMAHFLCVKKGIRPEKRKPDSNVCSIGFCEKNQKWYGWSHRAISGFGVGDIVKEGDVTAEYLKVGFRAKTLADARKMAEAFARSVA